jgi:hypothetical protein
MSGDVGLVLIGGGLAVGALVAFWVLLRRSRRGFHPAPPPFARSRPDRKAERAERAARRRARRTFAEQKDTRRQARTLRRLLAQERRRLAERIVADHLAWERSSLRERFHAWDEAETRRVRAELIDDMRPLFPGATDADLLRVLRDARRRARDLPTSSRAGKVPDGSLAPSSDREPSGAPQAREGMSA